MAEALDTFSDLEMSDSDDGNPSELNETFKAAADHMKELVSGLDKNKLLNAYSYYKQATEGACNIPRPKWYDVQAKQKWDAWNSLGTLSPDAAKEKYIAIISEYDPEWQTKLHKPSNVKANSQHWVTVSSLCNNDDEISDSEKTVYDFCKDGNVWQVQTLLQSDIDGIDELDSEGLGLIHWASDRGYLEMIKMLLKMNCNISLCDSSGQTALHYAVSCGHMECVKFLVQNGIDKIVKDNDGLTAADLTSDENILSLLE